MSPQVSAAHAVTGIPQSGLWRRVEDLVIRARWLAQAPEDRAPARPDGLYLYGPQLGAPGIASAGVLADWPHLDGPLRNRANAWFTASGLTFPNTFFGHDYTRTARQCLSLRTGLMAEHADTDSFFKNLLSTNPSVAVLTLVPSAAPAGPHLAQALANGATSPNLARARANIAAIRVKVANLSTTALAKRAVTPLIVDQRGRLEGGFDVLSAPLERAIWWASLGPLGPRAALDAAAGMGRLGAVDNAVDDLSGLMSAGPVRQAWERQWADARSTFDRDLEASAMRQQQPPPPRPAASRHAP